MIPGMTWATSWTLEKNTPEACGTQFITIHSCTRSVVVWVHVCIPHTHTHTLWCKLTAEFAGAATQHYIIMIPDLRMLLKIYLNTHWWAAHIHLCNQKDTKKTTKKKDMCIHFAHTAHCHTHTHMLHQHVSNIDTSLMQQWVKKMWQIKRRAEL